MAAKQKKNANYVTEKREQARVTAEKEHKAKVIRTRVLAIAIPIAVVALLVTGIILLGNAFGLWDERPEPTEHALIEIEGYGSLHVELYGNNAPETVAAFLNLIELGAYNGIRINELVGGMLKTSAPKSSMDINGEFAENGFENIVKHEKGVLSMSRTGDNNSANGEFFIVTDTAEELDGKYAAFGKITDGMDVLEKILEDIETDGNGAVSGNYIRISGISVHGHHH